MVHMSFCPDKPILAGFSGSFTPHPLPAPAGCHDNGAVVCLTRHTVNTPHPTIKTESGVSKNGEFLRLRDLHMCVAETPLCNGKKYAYACRRIGREVAEGRYLGSLSDRDAIVHHIALLPEKSSRPLSI